MMNNVFVFDTNSLVSASLIGSSTNSRALDVAIMKGKLAFSNDTLNELIDVLFRKKFDKYFLNEEERWDIIRRLSLKATILSPTEIFTDCRDPKDNKFLELAVAANANSIVSGDNDLLVLHPFRGIPIVKATDFLNMF